MFLNRLPEELLRIIFEYDNTYSIFYQKCIDELKYLYKTFSFKRHMFLHNNYGFHMFTYIPLNKLNNYNNYVLDYNKRKQSLRSYKNYKKFM